MSYPSQKRRLRPARALAALVAALFAAGAGLATLPSAQAVPTPPGPAGTVQTMGGTTSQFQQGGYGPEDAIATASQFKNPRGLGFTQSGNDIYVTDALNNRVRKIDQNGIVTLVAGNSTDCTVVPCNINDGNPLDATLWEPHGVAVGSDGSVYIADSRNCVIRKVAGGAIATVAGTGAKNQAGNCTPTPDDPDGPAKDIALDQPKSIFMTKEQGVDTLWVTDMGNNAIRKIDVGNGAAAKTTRVAGVKQQKNFGGDGANARSANLRNPQGVWVAKDGTVYITDSGNNLVRRIAMPTAPGGPRIMTTIAGDKAAAEAAAMVSGKQLDGSSSGDGGLAVNASLDGPRGIIGDDNGNLYIAEQEGARVRRIRMSSGIIDTIAGDGTPSPQGGGNSFIKGENGPALGTQFNTLHDLAINPADGSLWVADSKNNRIRAIFDPANAPGAVVPPGGNPTTTQPPAINPVPVPGKSGYWMLGVDGKVFAFGDAKDATFGDAVGQLPSGAKAIHIEPTPTAKGYWINDDRGGVYAFGDAAKLGGINTSSLQAGEQVTSLSATPSGNGYWLFTSKGRVFNLGDAQKFGDLGHLTLNGPIQSSIPTPSGKGYFMVGSDGGVFAFGDAVFKGSMGAVKLNQPVMSLVPTRDGQGYWLVASDGGIFAFNAPFKGSMGDRKLNKPVVGMVRYGSGYLMVGADGGIFAFSDKPFVGSLGANPPARPISFAATLDS